MYFNAGPTSLAREFLYVSSVALPDFQTAFASPEEVLAHPRFEAACAAFVDELAAVFTHNARMRGLGDFRQGICFQLLLCLDASRDPADPATLFTTGRIADAMGGMGMTDRRAIADLVRRLRHDGYATIERAAHDRRVLELRATDKAREADREWLQVLHRPLSILDPTERRFQLGAQRDPAYQQALRAVSLRHLPRAGQVLSGHRDAWWFVQQTLGARIMMTLMQAVRGRRPRLTEPGFYAWAARRCGVSAPHIRKVMQGAAQRDLVVLSDERRVAVEVTPRLEQAVRGWTAACLATADLTSRSAMEYLAERTPPPGMGAGRAG